MRKWGRFLIFILISVFLLYFFSDLILTEISEWAITYFMKNINVPNLEYTRPIFKGVRISSFNAITWRAISADAFIVRDETKKVTESISIKIQYLTISLVGLAERAFLINMKGINATATSKKQDIVETPKRPSDRVEEGDIKFKIKLGILKRHEVLAQVRDIAAELKKFSQTGVTKIPVEFTAEEAFEMQGKPQTAKVWIEQEGDEYRLIMDEASLKKIALSVPGFPLTAGDLKALSRNPIRAPQLLRIRNKAVRTAAELKERLPEISEDACRHVLWAYLLTGAYGEEFAKECGDAHEIENGADEDKLEGNKEPDVASYQDFNNNAVGRRYALNGYEESSLPQRILTDPVVIRDNEIAARYDRGELMRYRNGMTQYLRGIKK